MSKIMKRIIIIIIRFIVALIIVFGVYVSIFYKAEANTIALMAEDNVELLDNEWIRISNDKDPKETMIFYPGAKVEYTAYLTLLEDLASELEMTIYLLPMPFNLAIFDSDQAGDVIEANKEVTRWYIGGHSMGAAMASKYASDHPEQVEGLILLAGYLYGDYPSEKTLTVYGSLNTSVEEKIDYTQNVVVIEGGNHAQFGNYGEQRGDAEAKITREQQQAETIEVVKQFIQGTE